MAVSILFRKYQHTYVLVLSGNQRKNSKFYGKKHNPETLKLLSDRLKEVMNRPEVRKRVSEGVRKSLTEERRKQMSESRRGKKRSPESIEKGAKANTGKKRTQETKNTAAFRNRRFNRQDFIRG